MTRFGNLLEENEDTIVERWRDAVLSVYPPDAAALFRAQQDPFANPLGHRVSDGTRGLFRAILHGSDRSELRKHLDQIIRIRAVQELPPSQALAFVFSLRSIVREVIPGAESRYPAETAELDGKIDDLALAAFDLYAARREELGGLRINEIKRQVAWVLRKMNPQSEEPEGPAGSSRGKTSTYQNVHREDL